MSKHEPRLEERPFTRVKLITSDHLLGARWWHEGMQATAIGSPSRRAMVRNLLATGGILAVSSGGILGTIAVLRGCDDEPVGALEMQRKEGWDVGSTDAIEIPDAVNFDSGRSSSWYAELSRLGDDLAPSDPKLLPLFVPTLFDALRDPRSDQLAARLRPMHSWEMEQAYLSSQGLAELFNDPERPKSTALVLDMPGPLSVAAAAGVAGTFTPVFLYDNWPHPHGVVPSHLTLSAALYHRPDFINASRSRQPAAPPAFVLDSDRLLPYRDESDRFDNRFLARMPTATALKQLGIQRVLYVTAAEREEEQDDLNEDFVAYANAGIDVKLIALTEFDRVTEHDETNGHSTGDSSGHSHSYHGHSARHATQAFSSAYDRRRSAHIDPLESSGRQPRGARYSPKPRSTLFKLGRLSPDLVHLEKSGPRSFGHISSSTSRSGSLGRVGGYSFG